MSKIFQLPEEELCDESFDVGVLKAWFYESSDVDTTTVDSDTETITAFALKEGKKLVTVAFDDETASLNSEHSEGKRSKVTQNLSLFFEGLTSFKRKILKSYKDCRCLSAFVKDANGRIWSCGTQIVKGKLYYKYKTNGGGSTNTQTSISDEDSGFQRVYRWTVKDDPIEITAKGDAADVETFLNGLSAAVSSN